MTGSTTAVKCQHCAKAITPGPAGAEIPEWWEDVNGFTQCIKAAGPLPIMQGSRVMHTPMPLIGDRTARP